MVILNKLIVEVIVALFFCKLSYDIGFKQGHNSTNFDITRHDRKMSQCIEALANR